MEHLYPPGWRPRGAPIEGPGSTVQPLEGPGGLAGLGVRYRDDLVEHPMVQKGIDEVADFVRAPGVPGILPLASQERSAGLFVYPVGQGRLLPAVMARSSERGLVPGERAAIELVRRVAAVLEGAARADGPATSHGSLTPWRIAVYPDGDVALLGYALPPVEVVAWLDGNIDVPPGHSLLYSPPERIQDDNEDVRSDLYALAVIAVEFAQGAPIKLGTDSPQEIVELILRGAVASTADSLSRPVRTLLRRMLAPAAADRPRSGAEVANEARVLLRTLPGRTLGGLVRGANEEVAPPAPPPVRLPAAPVESKAPAGQEKPEGTYSVDLPFGLGEVRYVPPRIRIPIPRFSTPSGVVDEAREVPGKPRKIRSGPPPEDAPTLFMLPPPKQAPEPEPQQAQAEPQQAQAEPQQAQAEPQQAPPAPPPEPARVVSGETLVPTEDPPKDDWVVEYEDRPEPVSEEIDEPEEDPEQASPEEVDGDDDDDDDDEEHDESLDATTHFVRGIAPTLVPAAVAAAQAPEPREEPEGENLLEGEGWPKAAASETAAAIASDAPPQQENIEEAPAEPPSPQDLVPEPQEETQPEILSEDAPQEEPQPEILPEDTPQEEPQPEILSEDAPREEPAPEEPPGPITEEPPEAREPEPIPPAPAQDDRPARATPVPPQRRPDLRKAGDDAEAQQAQLVFPQPQPPQDLEPEPEPEPAPLPEGVQEPLFPPPDSVPAPLQLSGVSVDFARRVVRVDASSDGEPISEIGLALLRYLSENEGKDVSADEIAEALQGRVTPDAVRRAIERLRRQIERDPSKPDHLLDTADGGFRFTRGAPLQAGPEPLPEPGPLLGRDNELMQVLQAFAESRLVSVIGPPGSGAPQVALHAAHALRAQGWEIHRCALDGHNALQRLAVALGLRQLPEDRGDLLDQIGAALASRPDILVLLDGSAKAHDRNALLEIIMRFGRAGMASSLLVVGQNPIGIDGESVIALQALGKDEAIALLRRRVSEIRPGTVIDDALAEAITTRFDRMPLAIEEAAARTAYLPPEALLSRIDRGMAWGEATFDKDLGSVLAGLDVIERSVVHQCAAFRDGFDLSAAEVVFDLQVPGWEQVAERAVISIIESLVAKALLRVVSDAESANVRWMLYETVRARALRADDPDLIAAIESAKVRHASHYGLLGLKLGWRPWVERADLAVLVRERENLRASMQMGGPTAAGAALGLTSILGHEPLLPLREAVDRLLADESLAEPEVSTWLAAARVSSARLDLHLGVPQRARAALRAASNQEPAHDPSLLVEVARLHTDLGSTSEAEAILKDVATEDPWGMAVLALLRGRWMVAKADKRAERAFVEAQHGFARLNADIGLAHTQRYGAETLARAGQGKRASSGLRQAMGVFESTGDSARLIECRMQLAELLLGLGAVDDANEQLLLVLADAEGRSLGAVAALARGLLGVVHALKQDWEESDRLFFLALAGSSPEHERIAALFALQQLLRGEPETAHEEAKTALPNPVAEALVAMLERAPAPRGDEAFLLYQALEQWRSAASLARIESQLGERPSIAVRMVLGCQKTPKKAAS